MIYYIILSVHFQLIVLKFILVGYSIHYKEVFVMNIPERISALRALMEERGYDVYMVPTDDFHQSEYVGDHFKVREYITGFTGSAGTAVFTKDEAGLWTDGRYFLQADCCVR